MVVLVQKNRLGRCITPAGMNMDNNTIQTGVYQLTHIFIYLFIYLYIYLLNIYFILFYFIQ